MTTASTRKKLMLLKTAIFNEIRQQDADVSMLDDELNRMFFRSPSSLRLSLTGFLAIKKVFTAYSFDIPATIRTKHHAGMSTLEYPYFFTNKRLVLFSESDALMVTLHGGVLPFLESQNAIRV